MRLNFRQRPRCTRETPRSCKFTVSPRYSAGLLRPERFPFPLHFVQTLASPESSTLQDFRERANKLSVFRLARARRARDKPGRPRPGALIGTVSEPRSIASRRLLPCN